MIGKTIAHFEIIGKLGAGGMGEVYRAIDSDLGREVALKVLPEELAGDAQRLARFEREARLLAALEHPHIAAIYGLEEADGRKLLVMQLVEGETLAGMLLPGPLPLERAARIGVQIASALESAHKKGVVHRDLKPSNIKVDVDLDVKVLDFGLAKAMAPTDEDRIEVARSPTLTSELTNTGVLLGTAAYMSPEQARGESADHRADIWAFGVIMMEMLTGRAVFRGRTLTDTLAAVLTREPDWKALPSETPSPIRRLIERCLDKEARSRLQSMGEARVALERYLEHPTEEASPPATPRRPALHRSLPWAVAAAAVVLTLMERATRAPSTVSSEPPLTLDVMLATEPLFTTVGPAAVLSPDGTKLAYSVGRSGERVDLYVRSLGETEGTLLASGEPPEGTPYNAFFSPDGEWVGFALPNALMKVRAAGGTPVRLGKVRLSRGASWSPHGTVVVAPSYESPLFRVSSAGGGKFEQLTTLDEGRGEATHRWPQVLPDGRAVLFTTNLRAFGSFHDANVEVLDLSSGERKVVLSEAYFGRYLASGHLAYVREGSVFAIPFDLDRLEVRGVAVPVVTDVGGMPEEGSAQFSASETGRVAYVSGRLDVPAYPILWVDEQGRSTVLRSEPGAYADPRLSPQGDRLALSVVRDGNWDVWVYDLERHVATRLTSDPSYEASAVWSADGEYVYFASDRDGAANVFRKCADGSGDLERVSEVSNTELYPLSVSPDGRYLLAHLMVNEGDAVVTLRIDGQRPEQEVFLATSSSENGAIFSPDGRWVAYSSPESGRQEVYIRPFPAASGKWQVSSGGSSAWPRWSADGRKLFYQGAEGMFVAGVEVAGGAVRIGRPRLLFEGAYQGGLRAIAGRFSAFDVDASGRRFVMFPEVAERRSAQVTLRTGWFEDLRGVTSN